MSEHFVLVGAGSAVFTRGLVADLILRERECTLALVDTDPSALTVAEGLARKMIESRSAPIRLRASSDRRDVLPGATAVICTIGVGGRRAWEQDVLIPRQHGIHQPVGDTVMPGGCSRAMRMIPAMVAIAEDVLELAPEALFFNYGNPMSAVCRAVRKATGAAIVGLCHGVHDTLRQLAQILNVSHSTLTWQGGGLNHLTWLSGLWSQGRDLWPEMLDLIPRDGEPATYEPFCWDLFRLFGAYPMVGDRHVTEFFPQLFPEGKYFGKTLGVDAFSFEATIKAGDTGYAAMESDALSTDPLPPSYWDRISGEHEQVIEIIDAIRTGSGMLYSANLPNRGQAPNLPMDAVIECPTLATADGLMPVMQPLLPTGVAGVLNSQFQCIEVLVEAALEGSRDKFVQALLLDGACTSITMAERLADDLL